MSGVNAFDDATTKDLIELVRFKRQFGLWSVAAKIAGRQFGEMEPVHISNDSGEVVPAFACMQATGTLELGRQNYTEVKKPVDTDGTAGGFLFNGPREIEIGGQGVAQHGPVLRAYKNSGTVTAGDSWRPTTGQWYITAGTGEFVAVGEDDIATNVLKVLQVGTPTTGAKLYRFTLNASLASGTADADILEMDGTDTTLDEDVLDPLGIFASLTTVGDAGLCLRQDGIYYVIQAPCP